MNRILPLPLFALLFTCQNAKQAENWCDQPLRAQFASLKEITYPHSDWFKVYEVGQGVYAIAEPYNFQEVISYFIVGENVNVLFDTGMGIASIRDLTDFLDVEKAPGTMVINSHSHYDHIGGNYEFSGGIIMAMDLDFTKNRAAEGMAHEVVRHEVTPEAFCLDKVPEFDTTLYQIRPYKISGKIRDGARISMGGRTLQVLHVPGHTPDAIALYDEENGYLWTGDTFYEAPIWLFDEGTDLEAYQKSTERLAALVPKLKTVFPAHNTPVAAPERLTELKEAFALIMDGSKRLKPNEEDAHTDSQAMTYQFEHFSFIIRRDELEKKGVLE